MPTTEATAEVKAIFSVVDQATAPILKITRSLDGVAQAAKGVSAELPRSLAEVAGKAGVAWRPADIVAPVTPAVTDQVTAAAGAIAPAIGDQISQATAAIDKVSGHWGKLRADIDLISDRIGTRLRSMFESVEGVAGRVAGRIGKAWESLGGSLATFGVGGAIGAGIEYAFHGMEKLVTEVEKLKGPAAAIGVPISELQDLHRWASDAGVDVGKLDNALEAMTVTLGKVQAGGDKAAREAFADLKVDVVDPITNAVRSTSEVLPDVIDALNKIDDPTRKAADAAAIFKRGWKDIPQLAEATSTALGKAREEQEKIGHISDEQAKRAVDFATAHKRMSDALNALQETIGSTLLPAMTPLVNEITSITEAFNRWAQTVEGQHEIEQTFKDIADFLHSSRQDIEAIEAAMKWIGEHTLSLPGGAKPVSPEGAPTNIPTWTPGGVLAPSAPSPGGGPLSLEGITGAPPAIVPPPAPAPPPAVVLPPAVPPPPAVVVPLAPAPPPAVVLPPAVPPPPAVVVPLAPAAAASAPTPASLTAPAPAPVPPNGTVNVNITHENAPPGTRMNVSTQGQGIKTTAQTGYSMPQIQAPWAPPPP